MLYDLNDSWYLSCYADVGAGDSKLAGHSIIAVEGDGDPTLGDDGVVGYTSAHLDGMESEFIVRSGHSCQGHPFTIEEVRRILLEHLGTQAGEDTKKQ